jgi:ketopantoate reductase
VNEEMNADRERAIRIKTRGAKNAYKLARAKERRLFRKKARQLGDEALIEIERHRSSQDSRKFYKRLNVVRRPFETQVAMCRAKNGELLTNKNQVLEHFEEHLNEGFKSEQPKRPTDLRDVGVDIDLPSREEIEGALKYLKNNKAAGADFIAAELLKNGGPNLVDALHE